ncbi:MAG: hypothetical protein LBQ12_06365 [Deltaproteobacteria bacterium]|nr:hypothetical protein [Deltaproteobacteria bacterium]
MLDFPVAFGWLEAPLKEMAGLRHAREAFRLRLATDAVALPGRNEAGAGRPEP